jgi:hypothetical protein
VSLHLWRPSAQECRATSREEPLADGRRGMRYELPSSVPPGVRAPSVEANPSHRAAQGKPAYQPRWAARSARTAMGVVEVAHPGFAAPPSADTSRSSRARQRLGLSRLAALTVWPVCSLARDRRPCRLSDGAARRCYYWQRWQRPPATAERDHRSAMPVPRPGCRALSKSPHCRPGPRGIRRPGGLRRQRW